MQIKSYTKSEPRMKTGLYFKRMVKFLVGAYVETSERSGRDVGRA